MMTTTPVPSSSDSEIQCDICQQSDIDDNNIPTATYYCCDCNENQCTKCNEFHRKLNASNHHKIVNISGNSEREFDEQDYLEEDLLSENSKKNKDFKRILEERRKESNNLEHVLQQSRKESKNLEQKLEEIRKESKKLEQVLHESRRESKIFEQKLEESRKISNNLEHVLYQSRKESENLEQVLEEIRKERKHLEKELQESRKESKIFEQKFEESRKETKNLKQELQKSRKDTAEMKEHYEESRKETAEMKEHYEESRKENAEMKEHYEESRKENAEMKEHYEESRKETAEMKKHYEESRKETAEMKEQYRILKESFDKALHREKNLKKELDAIKSRAKPGTFGNIRKALDTTSKSSKPQQSHANSSLESSKLFDSKVFVFGIDDVVSFTKDIIEINLNRSEDVSKAQRIPVEMTRGSAAAVLCDSIFVTGIGEKWNEIWSFNVTSSKWKTCASLIQGRLCHSVVFVDQVLYICGGLVYSDKKTLDNVEAYDTHEDQCVIVGKLTFAVYGYSNCVPFKSSLYIFGGSDANDKIVNKVQVYDTKLNTCTLLSKPIPGARCLLRAVLWENTVILLGYNGCFTFNFKTQVWQVKHYFKTGMLYFGLLISNGFLFVIGGGDRIKDAYGNKKWICRDYVRCVPVANILKNTPIDWRQYAKLPKPSLVYAFGKMDFVLK